jgi:hypothetical protein
MDEEGNTGFEAGRKEEVDSQELPKIGLTRGVCPGSTDIDG